MRSGDAVTMFDADRCGSSVGDGGRGFKVARAMLGVRALDRAAGVHVVSVITGEYASSGEIEITGYDPASRSICGRYEAVFEARSESGTFAARHYPE